MTDRAAIIGRITAIIADIGPAADIGSAADANPKVGAMAVKALAATPLCHGYAVRLSIRIFELHR
jgi:hypothetical protein